MSTARNPGVLPVHPWTHAKRSGSAQPSSTQRSTTSTKPTALQQWLWACTKLRSLTMDGLNTPCLMAAHMLISRNRDLTLVFTACLGPQDNTQLGSTAGTGKPPALTPLPLLTEQTETIFRFSEQRRGRTRCESAAVLPFHDVNPSPGKHSCGSVPQGTEQSLLSSTAR